MGIEAFFDGMEKAEVFGKGQYFKEGNFRVRTKALKVNNGNNGLCFIAEFEVVSSDQPIDAEGKQADPPGSTRSWVVKMGPTNKNAFSDIKSFVFALLGVDPKKAGKPEENPQLHAQATQAVKAACDAQFAATLGLPPNAFEGRDVLLQTWVKATKPKPPSNEPGKFTVHNWAPAPALAPVA